MNSIAVFNPEHDLALSNGDRHFIAPRNIREMARDLAPLLDVIEGDQLLIWGWDSVIKEQLCRMGVTTEKLPTDAALTALRASTERKSAHHLLRTFHADHPEGPYIGESILVQNIDEVLPYASKHGHIVLKDPLSSSGKGLRHVNINENEDKNENLLRNALSSSLKKVESWTNALVRRHGYLTAEPYYNKVQDFAMEFRTDGDGCHFIGYSYFNTNAHGRYESNLLVSDEKIEALLSQYVPQEALREVKTWIVKHVHHIIPSEWDTTKHPLYFGIDMMIVETTDNRQRTTDNGQQSGDNSKFRIAFGPYERRTSFQNSEFRLHPCVEINLRLNMGIIAHEVRKKILAPTTEGTFHIVSFSTEELVQDFHKKLLLEHPPIYQEGKIHSGYHPLTPILPHTRHHAFVICKESL